MGQDEESLELENNLYDVRLLLRKKIMKIAKQPDDIVYVLIGVFAGTSFYKNFDEIVFMKYRELMFNDFKNKNTREQIYELVKKIQSHWNDNNTASFERIFNDNKKLFKDFFKAKSNFNKNSDYGKVKKQVEGIVNAIVGDGIQNTKVSKLLYVVAPDLIPMIDNQQGRFVFEKYDLGNYSYNRKINLLSVFEKLHEAFGEKQTIKKITKITNALSKRYKITITGLRAFEILIWLQTQCETKELDVELLF